MNVLVENRKKLNCVQIDMDLLSHDLLSHCVKWFNTSGYLQINNHTIGLYCKIYYLLP